VGYDLLAGIAFACLTPLVLLGFVVFWLVNAKDHEELAALWRRYAAARGLAFVEPEGEWPNRTSPAIAWTCAGAHLCISRRGREARVRTRLTVRPSGALLGVLSVVVDGAGGVAIQQRPPGLAARLLTDHVRRLLLGFRQQGRVTLTYRRGRVAVEWAGGEQNDARLDEARDLGAALARAVDEGFAAAALVSTKPAA
jgi:hypothetical protein